MRALALGLLAVLLFGAPVVAAKPYAGAEVVTSNLNYLVEQQTPGGQTQPDPMLWVANTTGCAWDPDDLITASIDGRLARGESVSVSVCLVGDWAQHLIGARVTRGDVTVGVALSGLRSVSGSAACIIGPDYEHDSPKLLPIADSNGGVGAFHSVTWTLTNTSHRPQWAAAIGEIRLDLMNTRDLYCPGSLSRTPVGQDPVVWWSG